MISFENRLTPNVADNQAIELMKGFDIEKFADLYLLYVSQAANANISGFVAQILHWKTMTHPKADIPDFTFKSIESPGDFGPRAYKDN